jgi:arylsulfatase A-like enzyme
MIAAWFGLVAGFSEGVADLTAAHFHAPAILCVTLLADLAILLTIGLVIGLARRAVGRVALVFFIFTWILFLSAGASNTVLAIGGVVSGTVGLLAEKWFAWSLRIVRRSLPWLAAAAAVCLIAIPLRGFWSERQAMQALPAIAPDAPNVLLVILDTVRADHLSCYGYGRATSPNMDRLARQGLLFDTAIATSSWTLPSHASMMTGTYPHTHHVNTPDDELASGYDTLPWALRQAGYRTAAYSANTFFFSRQNGLGQGFIRFGDFFLSPTDALAQVNFVWGLDKLLARTKLVGDYLGRERAAQINRAALRWIDGGHRPFFLVLNYMDAHDPYVPPQPWRHRFSDRLTPGGRTDSVQDVSPRLTPTQIQDEVDAYDGGIAYEDHQLGRLLAALKERGLLANALVVVTSDHGEAFGGHGLLEHMNALYFPLVHVPLVLSWPGHVPAGVRVARPVSTRDIADTILGLLGRSPDRLPGKSLEALWTDPGGAGEWPLPLSELAAMKDAKSHFPDRYGPLETIVAPEAQYILDPRLGPLLYDWKSDPEEIHNLIHDPRYQARAAELGDALKAEQRTRSRSRSGMAAESPPRAARSPTLRRGAAAGL